MQITAGMGATYLDARHGEMRIDLLTVAGRSDAVHRHEPLNVDLQPLKFMEFSLEKTTQTAIVSGENAVIVNIPSPLRHALHKLVVMAQREARACGCWATFHPAVAKQLGAVLKASGNAKR